MVQAVVQIVNRERGCEEASVEPMGKNSSSRKVVGDGRRVGMIVDLV